jgi:two-component system LytT family response regulator
MQKVVLVDDEKAGRTLIREYLAAYPQWIIVGEANNGVDAIHTINKFKPDLVFMDVQMPGMTGFEVLPHLNELPAIIFSTTFDQYALKAFEVHAVDYLLKPYTKERFDTAMARLSATNPSLVAPLVDRIVMESPKPSERFLVEHKGRFVTLSVADIQHISAERDYSKLHTAEQSYLSNHGIGALESKLDPKRFIRVHRSHILQIDAIREIEKYGKGYSVLLASGEHVPVSRGYADRIREMML